jgi:hypothetical protein
LLDHILFDRLQPFAYLTLSFHRVITVPFAGVTLICRDEHFAQLVGAFRVTWWCWQAWHTTSYSIDRSGGCRCSILSSFKPI